MCAAACGFALMPLLLWLGTLNMSLWIFVGMWYLTRGGLWFGVRQTDHKDTSSGGIVLLEDLKLIRPRYLFLEAVWSCRWVFFVGALTLADPSVVTVVNEAWVPLFGLLTLTSYWRQYALQENESSETLRSSNSRPLLMVTMLAFGTASAALVVFSENEDTYFVEDQQALLGLLLAVISAVWGATSTMGDQLMGLDPKKSPPTRLRTAFVAMSGVTVVRFLLAPVFIVVGLVTTDSVGAFPASGLLVAVCAGLIHTASHGSIIYALNLAARKQKREAASVTSLFYLSPVLALLLLDGFADTNIARPGLFITGVAGVLVVNVALHLYRA